jgi:uncharacterized protein YfaS (alpha-2-macroglobulin family)
MQTEVCRLILAHADQTGGKWVLNETLDDGYVRILSSPLRTNGAVLSALTAFGGTPRGKTLVGDIPFRLVRYIAQSRKKRDHWENTQENMFCMNALIDYSRVYEEQAPDFKIFARLGEEPLGETKFSDLRDRPYTFKRPVRVEDPGQRLTLALKKKGDGRLYYAARLAYAPRTLPTERVNSGIEIHREYSVERSGQWVLLQSPMEIGSGDLIRVDLFISLPAARNFVVVEDPVPGGLEPVNRDLATASAVDADKGAFEFAGGSWWFRHGDWTSYGVSRWSFYHQELRHHAVRFYSEYLPAGRYHLSYTSQAIARGTFTVLPARAEEMYDPDIYGKGKPAEIKVGVEDRDFTPLDVD